MDADKKAMVIKTLESVVNQGINGQLRKAIHQFRLNKKYMEIQRNFLKRLLGSKAGMVATSFRKILSLPERINHPLFEKANKFEKGLSAFASKILRQSFVEFKHEFDEAQAVKKRAVIQLINATAGGQKRMYNRWFGITEKTRLMNECRLVSSIFSSVNFVIKSVSDNAFSENKDINAKASALKMLFKNLESNIEGSFRRWRELNNIERLRDMMTLAQKQKIITMLESIINQGRNGQLRKAINQFRLNRKYVEIQRNFLKRLLVSKAGMVVIAFRKMRFLPERIDHPLYEKANKFEKGLSAFAHSILKFSLSSFTTLLSEGISYKKLAVSKIINKSQNSTYTYYHKWL